MELFNGWKDDNESRNLMVGLFVIMFICLFWIYTTFSQANYVLLASQAQIYTGFLFFALSIYLVSAYTNKLPFGGLGTYKTALLASVVGLIIVFALNFTQMSSITGSTAFSISEANLSGIAEYVGLFYIVVSAPTAEELFFRGALFFVVLELLKQKYNPTISAVASTIIISIAFAGFHYFVYGSDIDAGSKFVGLFIFSVICILGNYIFKSIGFSLSFHYLNNLLSVLG
jgi:membrane protease YdiL (CAAX protease family)